VRGPPIVEEMRPAAPGRVTARLKVNVIRKSNASKITPQYRRGAIEGRAELTAFPRTQDIGKPENPPRIHQRSTRFIDPQVVSITTDASEISYSSLTMRSYSSPGWLR